MDSARRYRCHCSILAPALAFPFMSDVVSTVSVSRAVNAPAGTRVDARFGCHPHGQVVAQTTAAEWLRGATRSRPGAKFHGSNRNGNKSWKSVATVIDAVPGRTPRPREGDGPRRRRVALHVRADSRRVRRDRDLDRPAGCPLEGDEPQGHRRRRPRPNTTETGWSRRSNNRGRRRIDASGTLT